MLTLCTGDTHNTRNTHLPGATPNSASYVDPFLCDCLVVYHQPPVRLTLFILTVVESTRSCVVPKHDLIRKTFTYILTELMTLDGVTTEDFQTRSCHFQTFQVTGISCVDHCIRDQGGARAVRQTVVIHKCGVFPMFSVPTDSCHKCISAYTQKPVSIYRPEQFPECPHSVFVGQSGKTPCIPERIPVRNPPSTMVYTRNRKLIP